MAQATDLPLPPSFHANPPQEAGPTSNPSGSSMLGEKKIPKWLKVGLSA
jgi:hypothetical protein